jgi:hypothetical protein
LGIQSWANLYENKRGDEIPPPIDEISISGFEADGIVRTEPDGTTPLIRIHEHRIDYVLRQH